MIATAVLLTVAALWSWQHASRRGESPHRIEMYQQALENVRSRCVPVKPELESYCRDHATLLLDYPECDAECVTLVRKIRGEPTR